MLRLDGHFGNLRADGDRIYLVDFGLATSPRFDLSGAERAFASRNLGHDADYAAMRLVNWLVATVCVVPLGDASATRDAYVRRCADGEIPPDVPAAVAGILARHAPAAARMNEFCWRLFGGDIHAEYPARQIVLATTSRPENGQGCPGQSTLTAGAVTRWFKRIPAAVLADGSPGPDPWMLPKG